MNKLEVAMYLIQEAMEEKRRLEQYKKEREKAIYNSELTSFYERWDRVPNKSKVNDDLKMARRLLRESYE